MRVTFQQMYSSFYSNMNSALSDLVNLNLQAQTQKKINNPSDDPVGMAHILSYRDELGAIDQYQDNISTATAWLGLSDDTLGSVSDLISSIKELANQAATGTLDADNRAEIASQVRELYAELIALSNTEYDGKSIYAGQQTDGNAYEETLWLTTNDEDLASDWSFSINGDSDSTILIQFLSNGGATTGTFGTDEIRYRYSTDGGETFKEGVTPAGSTTISLDGVEVEMSAGSTVTATAEDDTNDSSGTWVWVRPTVKYLGDYDGYNEVAAIGQTAQALDANALGSFDSNVYVRIDNTTSTAGAVEYSYSVDGGLTWVSGNVSSNANASNVGLSIPGGMLYLSNAGAPGAISSGDQFIVQPADSDIKLQISDESLITINDIGLDIFGGVYTDAQTGETTVAFGSSSELCTSESSIASENLFEAVGNLIAFLETNNEDGIGQCIDALDDAQNQMLGVAASVGGRENRLTITGSVLETVSLDVDARLSDVEDVDVAELMTDLTQQQLVYQAVLKSSSLIMNLSLLSYV
ncbi:MAG: flagellar hook-associated protein 3 FlgL [Desulfovibrionales bacterium]|nr:flagellar hook-associated protein 3 FlgL [Desulfovibrionales bacterium]